MANTAPLSFARSLLAFLLWSAALLLLILLYALLVEPNRIVVEHATFEMPSRVDPAREGTFRLAFVSDFDLTSAPGWYERRVRRVVNGLEADLVAVGGDLLGGDHWEPDERVLEGLAGWLSGFRARDGMVVVWGEQDLVWAEQIRAVLPDGVRELHRAAELHDAGTATVRVVGPEGMFAPLSVDPQGEGALRAGRGPTLTVAHYRGAGAAEWTAVDLLATLRTGGYEDAAGLAVMEAAGLPGYRFQVQGPRAEWTLTAPGRLDVDGRRVARGAPVVPRREFKVRVRVRPGAHANVVTSRVWPAGAPEPAGWQIEVIDRREERPRRGTVGVVTGGGWADSGEQRWLRLRANGLDGRVLLDDEFDDPARFRRDWSNPGGEPGSFDATVVVGHQAARFLSMPPSQRPPIDLVLAGHTHGGQVRLPLFGPLHLEPELPREWSMGWVRLPSRRSWLYTSRGLGVSRVPLRFLCPPEVTLMEILLRHRPPR